MEIRLLGPVELSDGVRVREAGTPQQAHVVAALAVDAGRLVTTPALIDRVWDAAPDGARRALHAHIARVRRVLAEAGATGQEPARVVHRSGGYVLDLDPNRVDAHRFRALVERAREPGCPAGERAGLLRQALDLWRGEALAGLPGGWAAGVRDAWAQRHLNTVLVWSRAELAAGGDPGAVVGVLTELVSAHPLVESLAAALMRALCAAGRSADALETYAGVRERLADELGADPGAELRGLHQAILRGELDPPSPAPETATAVAPPASGIPAQLPLPVRGFTGRAGELDHLETLLPGDGEPPGAVVISGTAGVGKSALALHWAHRMAPRFSGGQLYVNLRGFDPGGHVMDPSEAIRAFLDAFGVPPQRIPTNPGAQAGLYRSLLADRRVLVVLDNARDAEQVRPLLPAAPGCLALVTSRNQLHGLVAAEGAHPLTLDLLTDAEAHDLLTTRLGTARVAAEPQAVTEIVTRCARLPLALAIVAARAATHPHFPLHTLAAELGDSAGLDVFAGGDPGSDARAVFSWSYQALDPEAARLFRLLGLHPGPDLAAPAAASLTGLSPARVRPLLARLTRAHLLTEHTPGRYAFHDLLRGYATELIHTHDTAPARRAALQQVIDYYLHTAHAAALLLHPYGDPVTLARPRQGATPENLTSHGQALTWLTTERPVLLKIIDQAADAGFDTHTWQLAWTLRDFLHWRGHWDDQAATQHTALHAARRLNDGSRQAHSHRDLGSAYGELGRYDDAHLHLRRGLDLFGELGDPVGQATTHRNLSWVCERQGNLREKLGHSLQSLELSQAAGHQVGQALALNSVGWSNALLGNHRQALAYCQQALELQQQLGDRDSEAYTWDSLGYAHHHLGHHRRAITCYQHALTLCRDLGNRYLEAETLTHLGDTHNPAGERDAAREAWQHALTILAELDHPDADQVRAKLHHLDEQ